MKFLEDTSDEKALKKQIELISNFKIKFDKLSDQDSILEENTRNLIENKYKIYFDNDYKSYLIKAFIVTVYDYGYYTYIRKIMSDIIDVLDNTSCSKILTPKQVGPICWFMSTFVAMFYSQRSREIILKVSKRWNTDKILSKLLKRVLNDYYLSSKGDKIEYMKFKGDEIFVNILTELHKENKTMFAYNPDKSKGGFNPIFYIGRLYNLLNIDYTMFEYNIEKDSLVYSLLNEEFNSYIGIKHSNIDNIYNNEIYNNEIYNIKGKYFFLKYTNQINNEKLFKKKPPILIVSTGTISDIFDNTKIFYGIKGKNIFNNEISDTNIKNIIQSMDNTIYYNDGVYHLDSVLLTNWNKIDYKHSIAGITCKDKRFVYNGWTRTSMDPVMIDKNITLNIPCELMPYDWNVKHHGDFCLNNRTCILDIMKIKKGEEYNRDLCFNFNKGNRILVYVRKDEPNA